MPWTLSPGLSLVFPLPLLLPLPLAFMKDSIDSHRGWCRVTFKTFRWKSPRFYPVTLTTRGFRLTDQWRERSCATNIPGQHEEQLSCRCLGLHCPGCAASRVTSRIAVGLDPLTAVAYSWKEKLHSFLDAASLLNAGGPPMYVVSTVLTIPRLYPGSYTQHSTQQRCYPTIKDRQG